MNIKTKISIPFSRAYYYSIIGVNRTDELIKENKILPGGLVKLDAIDDFDTFNDLEPIRVGNVFYLRPKIFSKLDNTE